MSVTSPAFSDGSAIPVRHTCYGRDLSFPLVFRDVPFRTACFALVLRDIDNPEGVLATWVVWDVPGSTVAVDEGGMNRIKGAVVGQNDSGRNEYDGPCRLPDVAGFERRRYELTVQALDFCPNLEPQVGEQALSEASQRHVLAEGTLTGYYRWY